MRLLLRLHPATSARRRPTARLRCCYCWVRQDPVPPLAVPCIHSRCQISETGTPVGVSRNRPLSTTTSAASSSSFRSRIMTESAPLPAAAATDSNEKNQSSSLQELCANLNKKVQGFLAQDTSDERLKSVQKCTRESLSIIEEALKRYSLSELSFSYNGGKDCLVLLILYLSALSSLPSLPLTLESIYIVPPHPFLAVDDFVASSAFRYHLSLLHLRHPSMKEAFTQYLSSRSHVKAIFVGTRRTDPHGEHLTSFDMTDGGWPSFMRIHPVLDWQYADIWAFLRHLEVPYCGLYDLGYTSLGGTKDTLPNPRLKIEGTDRFRPAYELVEDDEERAGREAANETKKKADG